MKQDCLPFCTSDTKLMHPFETTYLGGRDGWGRERLRISTVMNKVKLHRDHLQRTQICTIPNFDGSKDEGRPQGSLPDGTSDQFGLSFVS